MDWLISNWEIILMIVGALLGALGLTKVKPYLEKVFRLASAKTISTK